MRHHLILASILILATFLRFYNLMHDAPYFFDPDERNMAGAISQFRLPANLSEIPSCLFSQFSLPTSHFPLPNCNLNPHFFAYGQFPLYLAFFSDQIHHFLTTYNLPASPAGGQPTTFFSAIFWLRFYSALASTLTILLVYLITKELFKNLKINSWNLFGFCLPAPARPAGGGEAGNLEFGILAALLAAITPGLIQSAHFGTTESLLTFFFMASVYLSIRLLNSKFQAPNHKQTPSPKHQITSVLNLKTWNLFGFCLPAPARPAGGGEAGNLDFGILLLLSLILGLSLGTKLTGLFFFTPICIALLIQMVKKVKGHKKKWCIGVLGYLLIGLLVGIGSIFFFILSSPYNFIDFPDFKSAVFGYEADVAIGRYPAFYTRQFVDTKPIIFQAEKIFPYALGWPVFVFGILGLILIIISIILKTGDASEGSHDKLHLPSENNLINRNRMYRAGIEANHGKPACRQAWRKRQDPLIIIITFLAYLLPHSFLFVKWTRFMTPSFPFFSIFAVYFLFQIRKFIFGNWIIGLLIIIGSITPGMAYMSVYTHPDTRILASEWIYKNIPNNSYILSETGNVVDIPLALPNNATMKQFNNYQVISFDFYHLDEGPLLFQQLINHLIKADYIFIPSRRIFANYTRFPDQYPLITKYYQLLYSGKLGYEEITRISSFPSLTLPPLRFTLSDEDAEETFTVFDHPVIRIYKKTKPLIQSQYEALFK